MLQEDRKHFMDIWKWSARYLQNPLEMTTGILWCWTWSPELTRKDRSLMPTESIHSTLALQTPRFKGGLCYPLLEEGRHREDQEARKSLIFKSTEQNTRTGSKIKSSPLRTSKMEQSSPVGRLSLERSPEAMACLGGRFLWTLQELRLWHSNPAVCLRFVHSLRLEKSNLKLNHMCYKNAHP